MKRRLDLGRARRKVKPWRKQEREAAFYGNYRNYYGYRSASLADDDLDPRLAALDPQWMRGSAVLDVGCNVGKVTLQIARHFACRHVVGIDIDASLIKRAKAAAARAGINVSTGSSTCITSRGNGDCAHSGKSPNDSDQRGSIHFHCGDITSEHVRDALGKPDPTQYDTICAFSVSKWLHLRGGDAGLMRFFSSVFALLRPGGRFVLEPQPWSSYKRKYWNQTDQTRAAFRALELRPGDFERVLTTDMGFSPSVVHLWPGRRMEAANIETGHVTANACENGASAGTGSGFDRPILVFTKPNECECERECEQHEDEVEECE